MSDTSRERVLKALNRQEPDRVPFSFGFGPTVEARSALDAWLKPRGGDFAALARAASDIRSVGARYTGAPLPENTDIWGIRRKMVSYGGGSYDEIDFSPLAEIETVEGVEKYPWPSVDDFDFSLVAEDISREGEDGRYAVLAWGGGNPFEIYTWMTGLEKALVNLVMLPEVVRKAMERITDFFCEFSRRMLEAGGGKIDLVFTADDLGGQNGLLISPRTYRESIRPFHKKLHDVIHAAGAKTLYHSDGSVVDVLDDLCEAGVDVLEAVQVDAAGMDPVVLKERFGEKLCFHGGVSVQQLLPDASVDEVRSEVARLKRILGAGGGYICAPTHAIQLGTPPENVIAMVEEATETSLEELLSAVKA